jgi:hypothetical protein
MPTPEKTIALIAENPFLQLLSRIDNGRFVTELTERYPILIEAVKRTGKRGEMTITIKVKPDGKGEVETVDVDAEVKGKLPVRDRRATTFFIGKDHLLQRVDPHAGQEEIAFPAPGAAAAGGQK